jgi:hypothetical protein
MPAHLKAT